MIVYAIIDVIMASTKETETGVAFINARKVVPVRQTLESLGHSQAPMPLQLDNTSTAIIINDTIKQRRSKPIEIRFYWLKDRER